MCHPCIESAVALSDSKYFKSASHIVLFFSFFLHIHGKESRYIMGEVWK